MSMKFRIGLENGDEGRSQAWVLGHPGCFAYGPDPQAALAATSGAIRSYIHWAGSHGDQSWLPAGDFEIELEESWQVYTVNEEFELLDQGYTVNAWFRYDWKPLSAADVERGQKLLAWSRSDLQEIVRGLNRERLDRKVLNERWSIDGILRHVANAEWWYLDRLGLASPRESLPEATVDRLALVRECLLKTLPDLVGSRLVVGKDGEFWSPQKLLRRAAWHERDHTQHIAKLIPKIW